MRPRRVQRVLRGISAVLLGPARVGVAFLERAVRGYVPALTLTAPRILRGFVQERARQLKQESRLPVLMRAAQSSVPEFRLAAARNRRTPRAALIQVAIAARASIKRGEAVEPADIFRVQALSLQTLAAVAAHRHAPRYLLTQLARHADPAVVRGVAAHRQTAPVTLAWLSRHHNATVRVAVRDNPHTPAAERARLAFELST